MKHQRLFLYPRGGKDKDWSPFTLGTFEDIREAGIELRPGMRLRFYDEDADELGNPDDLLFEGTAEFVSGRGWGAVLDSSTFHWESDERKGESDGTQS